MTKLYKWFDPGRPDKNGDIFSPEALQKFADTTKVMGTALQYYAAYMKHVGDIITQVFAIPPEYLEEKGGLIITITKEDESGR